MYEQVERITTLLRANIRRESLSSGLQPVQMEALHYLSRCNRYSNTPMAVAEFLGLTKGTVSQTLAVLEGAGYLIKETDAKDRRIIHMSLTASGQAVLSTVMPPKALSEALDLMSLSQQSVIREALTSLLLSIQRANGLKSFGLCASCRHHAKQPDGFRLCELTGETLSDLDAARICREHSEARIVA